MRESSSLTLQANGRLRVLVTDINIAESFDPAATPEPHPQFLAFKAIWDTGATGSVISARVVAALKLQPSGRTPMHTANGETLANTYLVNIRLPNGVAFAAMRVIEAILVGDEDVLIGMDIIGMGDFSITCHDGQTCMSFRIPSLHRIDYVEEHNRTHKPPKNRMKKDRHRMPWQR
jgi:predicted aspartyl protease